MHSSSRNQVQTNTVYIVAFLSMVFFAWDIFFSMFLMYRIQDFRFWLAEWRDVRDGSDEGLKAVVGSWFLLAPALLWDMVALGFSISLLTYGYQAGGRKRDASKSCFTGWMVSAPALQVVVGVGIFVARSVCYHYHCLLRPSPGTGVADTLSVDYVTFVTAVGAAMHLMWLAMACGTWKVVCGYREHVRKTRDLLKTKRSTSPTETRRRVIRKSPQIK